MLIYHELQLSIEHRLVSEKNEIDGGPVEEGSDAYSAI